MKYYCEDSQQVLQELNSQKSGLTEKEAAERLLQNGANELKAAKGKSLLRRFAEQVADPMIVILLAAAAISGVLAVLENDSFADVIIILAVVLINAVLGVYQESKAEKAIEALQDMAAATSKVVRDGKMSSILSKDLVVGDIICLEAGDAVLADARILESASLKAEEAALTGESVPVTKLIDQIFLADGERDVPLGDRKNMVYMGSTIVYGRAVAVVTATGMDTEMGKIADALSQAQEGQTPLQRKLTQLSKVLTKLVIGICVLVFAIQMIRAGSLNFEVALNSFMIAVSLAVAAIPEGLAAVVTVVLSIGVTNMSKRNAIIRRLTAVETLGCAQVICSDKTGTLTKATPTVKDVVVFGEYPKEEALRIAACLEEHFPHSMAKAVVDAAKERNLSHEEMHSKVEYIVAHGISSYINDKKVVIGSSHFVFEDEECTIDPQYQDRYDTLPPEYSHLYLAIEHKLAAVICIEDPLREEAAEMVKSLKAAGITKVVMMTGDSERTAAAIAKRVGVDEYYAEVLPEDKANFVEKEKSEGRKVIMIGDGINDSPALSAADAGIAISDGAEIAREIADITIAADDLREVVTLKLLSNLMLKRIHRNYRSIVGINSGLIVLGVTGMIQPTMSALLHNTSTLLISLRSMRNLLPEKEKVEL